jgi:hypothetical protein
LSPPDEGRRFSRWAERGVGIVVGVVLGVGIVAAFVFLGSEETIDAPRISGIEGDSAQGLAGERGSAPPPRSQRPPIATVRVEGVAPPESGPARLEFRRGSTARFRVVSDAPVTIDVLGYGISEPVESGDVISFRATRVGQFPVVVSGSNIGVATVRVQ